MLPRFMAAGEPYQGIQYREYARCLPDYLSSLAAEGYRRRNDILVSLSTPEAIQQRQEQITRTFWELNGGMPERTPLNARTVGAFERPGYRVEKVVYESRPGFHLVGNLYIPSLGEPPYPGVLFQMGHSLNGKAAATYQRCCQGLAQLGFVVLAFDPMGQGERTFYPGEDGYLTRLSSADDEHTIPGMQMLLLGDTSSRLQVWDAVRSLDYLAEHPLVDATKLASTGQSGGGTLTMLLAAVDNRLAAAAVACGNTENIACRDFNPPGSTDDAEQNLVGSVPRGIDRWDLLYPLAPKPLLVLVSARDYFGTYSYNYLSSGWEEFQALQGVYSKLGADDRIAWVDSPLPHNLAYDFRLEIYNWFLKWLTDEAAPVTEEPPTRLEADETLWVTAEGNVVRGLGSETPFSLNLKLSGEVQTPAAPEGLEELLKIDRASQPEVHVRGARRSGKLTVEAGEVQSAREVWVPFYKFSAREPVPEKPLLVVLEPQGRSGRWKEDDLYQQVAMEGTIVVAPDVRGIGDLRPEYPRGSAGYGSWHQSSDQFAWASLILGKPLLGQRVTDILALLNGLKQDADLRSRKTIIAAVGEMTVPALLATYFDASIDGCYLSRGLVSFRNVVETLEFDHPFVNFVPRFLHHADLPQLVAALAPRRTVLCGLLDAVGRRLEEAEVRAIYGNAGNLEVRGDAGWTVEALAAL